MTFSLTLIDTCLHPLKNAPCGHDPRYTDGFEQVKLEIEKLSGCDYSLIIQSCHALLSVECKDLRLAGYFCLALVHSFGVEGLLAGLDLYEKLLHQFAPDIHPQPIKARSAAIAWLNNPRFSGLLSSIEPISDLQRMQVKQAVQGLNQTIQTSLGKGFQPFNCLDKWLAVQTMPTKRLQLKEEVRPPQPLAPPPVIESEKQAHQLHLDLIHFWRQEKQWLVACQLARNFKWAQLSVPPDYPRQTAIAPPRKEALASLDKIGTQTDPEAMLEHCEALFLEPGGVFYLDLQWHAHEAALAMEAHSLATYLLQHTQWLCSLYPHLLTLSFANGLPFASAYTTHWLTDAKPVLIEKQQGSMTATLLLQQASQKATDLPSMLNALTQYVPKNALEGLYRMQAKALACQNAHRPDLALIYFNELVTQMDKQCLVTWLPEVAIQLWREIMNALNGELRKHSAPQQRLSLMERIRTHLCLLDDISSL